MKATLWENKFQAKKIKTGVKNQSKLNKITEEKPLSTWKGGTVWNQLKGRFLSNYKQILCTNPNEETIVPVY